MQTVSCTPDPLLALFPLAPSGAGGVDVVVRGTPFFRGEVVEGRTAVRAWALLAALFAVGGCDERGPVAPIEAAPVPSTHFDPARAGTVRGCVKWDGGVP